MGHTAESWFVARTKPNRDDYARRILGLRGLRVFMPRIIELECYATVTRAAPAPLFPGYLFVRANLLEDYHRLIWAPGIRDLVSLGGGPIPVDDHVIDHIRLRCDEEDVVRVSRAPFAPGDRVEISAGPFTGLLATVDTVMPRQRRIKLLVEFLARETPVDVPLTALKATRSVWSRVGRPEEVVA